MSCLRESPCPTQSKAGLREDSVIGAGFTVVIAVAELLPSDGSFSLPVTAAVPPVGPDAGLIPVTVGAAAR